MKHFFRMTSVVCACMIGAGAYGVSAGTTATNMARGVNMGTVNNTNLRGNQGLANAYKTNQRNTYYMVNVPDVDSACRIKIDKCLSDYCGDITVVPGQVSGRCAYAT